MQTERRSLADFQFYLSICYTVSSEQGTMVKWIMERALYKFHTLRYHLRSFRPVLIVQYTVLTSPTYSLPLRNRMKWSSAA